MCVYASYVKPTCLQFPAICAKWDAQPSSNNHAQMGQFHFLPEPCRNHSHMVLFL